ncbi:signal peptidase II [Planosporangium flavigriseum]|uniref:Lipoprotein signal peptidase n=1 Tax=Planosporangium flavigriseum TaxID=373681 RepID=A0A8J3LRS9_9ACTN|nr:signal peptidase II [Planosporangium flavigriseum]NJC63198.1 signal peptidase II [Planosporangium flavigriseum]GIG72471.1 lipoprotein signal peptidase [Planosporangium flavigriseum]
MASGPSPELAAQQSAPTAGPAPASETPARRHRTIGVLILASVVVLLIDIVTKQLAVSGLSGREPVRLLGGAVYLDLIRNSGAAFSLGTGYTFIFPIITIAVVGWIGWAAARRLRSVPWALALGLVAGGALGNLTDRIFRAPGPMVGHVVDMISVFAPRGEFFPVFNAADSALCVGVTLAVLLELTGRRLDGTGTRNRDRESVPDSAGG